MRSKSITKVQLLLLALWQTQVVMQCFRIMYKNAEERAIRTRSTRLLAQYSSSSGSLTVAFSSPPKPETVGTYRVRLIAFKDANRLTARDIGPMNVTWHASQQFASGRNASFTLLRVPMPAGFRNDQQAYKVHLQLLMYRNNTEVLSMATYSKPEPQCHVTFSPMAMLPQRPPTAASVADCAKRWGRRPPLLDRAFEQLGLKLTDDGCCLVRLNEVPFEPADIDSASSVHSSTMSAFATVAAASAGVAGSLLASCCAVAGVRAVRILRRKRVALAPSGAPYSLLAAHCRSVRTKEPLLGQGMAYRVYLQSWDAKRLCQAVLKPLRIRL